MTKAMIDGSREWSMLVHDLRRPLAAVTGHAELLRQRATRRSVQPADFVQSLQHIQDAVRTIEQLLDHFTSVPAKFALDQSGTCAVAQEHAAKRLGLRRIRALPGHRVRSLSSC
jgi:signal transduction histidine kinase